MRPSTSSVRRGLCITGANYIAEISERDDIDDRLQEVLIQAIAHYNSPRSVNAPAISVEDFGRLVSLLGEQISIQGTAVELTRSDNKLCLKSTE